ncbi:MAG TPA: DoxX family protein [Pirellulales bacterium]|nr:DoxX family protein [Pirellulales bacterium]
MTMTSETRNAPSKATIWIGWLLSALPSLLLLFSGSMKLVQSGDIVKMFEHLGYPEHLALILGIVEVGSTLVYLIPRTSVLGAILLTGYLGGAIATHVRLLEGQFLVPLVLGLLIWGGLFLRDPLVRAIVPVRRK